MGMMPRRLDVTNNVRLVVADVDGTLVTPDKILTPRASCRGSNRYRGGNRLHDHQWSASAGHEDADRTSFSSSHPITAFNGGLVVRPDLSVIREHLVPASAAQAVIDILTDTSSTSGCTATRIGMSGHAMALTWIAKSGRSQFPPTVVPTYEGLLDRVVKIVGVSDDDEAMARCVTEVQQQFGQRVSAALSQPYYLDVTHPKANKGEVVSALSALLAIPDGTDRNHRGHAERCPHVPAQRGEHRHG